MSQAIKRLIKSSISWAVRVAARTGSGRYMFDEVLSSVATNTQVVRHQGVELTFAVPNRLNHFRIDTFASKEPETLEWIDSIPKGSVLWDVGANIGLYTCYAAKAGGCRVFAFEPSVFNLELLARNIFLNGLTSQAVIVPLPLSDTLSVSALNMTSMERGGALSSFGQSYGHDGHALRTLFEFQTIGISMVDALQSLGIPQPDYIKMDVDGIEHLILKGGGAVLRKVAGVLVEINEEFQQQTVDSARYLREAGLVLKEKRHAEMFENSSFKSSYNQIWHRPAIQ
jgi:FkbM family methyltransferase